MPPDEVFEVPSLDITAEEYDRYCRAAARQRGPQRHCNDGRTSGHVMVPERLFAEPQRRRLLSLAHARIAAAKGGAVV